MATISANKANRLFWLGRYVQRAYMTLHLLRRVYDKMIDGEPTDYQEFWKKLDINDNYATRGEFTLGMLYDEENPGSVASSLQHAMDNAILLREDIKTETMSFIEISIAMLKKQRHVAESNVTNLQPITDWMLAFRGSAAQRIEDPRVLALLAIGQLTEKMDIMLRFSYDYERIATQYCLLKTWTKLWPELLDENIDRQICRMLEPDSYAQADDNFRWTLCKYVNTLVMV